MKNLHRVQTSKPTVPREFRRLALKNSIVKEIASEFEAGRYPDWTTALSAAAFALVAENERLQNTKAA
jgi:hypothetical protein